MTRAAVLALALLLTAAAPAARAECPSRYEFVLIADDTGELALSDAPYGSQWPPPAITADGKVAFTAWLDAGGRAIQLGDEHALRERLRDRDADPESDWLQLSDPLPSRDGKVVFGGMLEREPGTSALAAIAEITATGHVELLATDGGGRPGSRSEFRTLDALAFDVASNGEVLFAALLIDGPSAIVWGAGGATRPAVTAESGAALGYPAAGGPGELCYFEHGRSTVLRAQSGLAIAETDPATGLGPRPPVAMGEGGSVAYFFAYADPKRAGHAALQVRRYSPVTQTSRVLADSALGHFRASGEPGRLSLMAGEIDSTGQSTGFAGCVVFGGYGEEGRDAIFIADEDGVATVLIEGDDLLGAPVSSLRIGPRAANGHGQFAFWARAGGRDLIVRADPLSTAGGIDAGGADADPIYDPSEQPADGGGQPRPRDDASQRDSAPERDSASDHGGICAVRHDRRAATHGLALLIATALLLLWRRRSAARASALPGASSDGTLSSLWREGRRESL